MSDRMEFSGERVIPGKVESNLMLEHLSRYHFANQFTQDCHTLDLACGSGYGAAILSSHAPRVTAIDLSEPAVRYGKGKFYRDNIHFLVGNGENLPVADGCFDLVVAFEIIEHLQHPEKLLAEIRRVLRPEGMAILSTPNRLVSEEIQSEKNPYHVREYSPNEFQELLHHYFPHVVFGEQNHSEGISVFFPTSFASNNKSLFLEEKEWNDDLDTCQFLLALCSSQPLQKRFGNPFFYPSSLGNIVLTRDRHIRLFEAKVSGLEKRICDLETELEKKAAHIRLLEQQQEESRKVWCSLSTELKTKETHIRLLEDERDKALESWKVLSSELEIKAEHIELLENERNKSIDDYQRLYSEFEKQKNHVLLLLQEAENCRIHHTKLLERIEYAQGEYRQLQEEYSKKCRQLLWFENEWKQSQDSLSQLQEDWKKKCEHNSLLTRELEKRTSNYDRLQLDWQQKCEHISLLQGEVSDKQKNNQDQQTRLESLRNEIVEYQRIIRQVGNCKLLRLLKKVPGMRGYIDRLFQ